MRLPSNHFSVICLLLILATISCDHQQKSISKPNVNNNEWPVYGGDYFGSRYLPVSTINQKNVDSLQIAWIYRTGELEPEYRTDKSTSFQATPIVVDGVMYVSTPLGRVVALNPETGEEFWEYDPKIRRDIGYGDFANRGVATWMDETASETDLCRRRIYVGTAQSQLIALDSESGELCRDFGNKGMVNLREGLRLPPQEDAAYSLTSPPLAVNGMVIVGSSIADNTWPDPASGEIRAFDARSGEMQWSWDPIPQSPDDPAYDDWQGEMAHKTGGANAWSILSADPERDLVFIPTSSPAPDYYGAMRLGNNRYANSVVALRISTGELVWAFQTVRHDLWDYDNAAPPALTSIRMDGKEIPAVIQATKTGMMFILNRETGEPIFDVEDRPVPASDIPGEQASPTQPFTAVTPPLSPQEFSLNEIWGLSEEDRQACYDQMKNLRNEGIFTPPSLQGTLVFPSNIGGAHWGGVAIDPINQIAVVPVNRHASMMQLIPRDEYDAERFKADDERLGMDYEYNPMRGTPYVMRRQSLNSPFGLPCTPPPFGALVAVDLTTGKIKWDVPLGSFSRFAEPGEKELIPKEWGSTNLGGAMITEGGLVFIGAALDDKLHAFDTETGELLWTGELPASGRSTPMSYQLESGKQFVVITAGGGGSFGEGDYVIAFSRSK